MCHYGFILVSSYILSILHTQPVPVVVAADKPLAATINSTATSPGRREVPAELAPGCALVVGANDAGGAVALSANLYALGAPTLRNMHDEPASKQPRLSVRFFRQLAACNLLANT